ncbi:hypothetical protein DPMN_138356 [Dreissena polymorpha]|uniref:Uncharacterized protein n=1 Tax=Dreissena polymorpha TaxID=45954 RepID=A0A9D4JH78_DREPO|nr:hypothetical protein DPMN_138356 [Dreissena polymorpha]
MPYRTDSEAYREPYRGETITIYRPTEYRDTLNFISKNIIISQDLCTVRMV